ncbi:MAG: PD-(D/E)XK nuclease family protein [Gemmatimonadota bacterium]|nr:PD-(D/E)XK nuclease family protein [Gemmatimonadota bacterium]
MEVTTLRPLAVRIASRALAEARLRMIDPFDEQALVERAIDEVFADNPHSRFGPLAEKVGFRDAVRNSVQALRLGGVHVGRLALASIDDSEKQSLVRAILGRFEHLMEDRGFCDTAGVLERATALVTGGASPVLEGRGLFILPGLSATGVVGAFARALEAAGAQVLKTDPVIGLPPPKGLLFDVAPPETALSYLHGPRQYVGDAPSIELFCAASIYDELRGVLRRALHAGARWDEVEIITPDPAAYGSALHALTSSLGIPVTFAVGLPVERTRPGRVVSEYFRWLDSGFQESVLRGLIEAGDLVPQEPHDWIDGPRLARALRSLRIGWGRSRYLEAIDRRLASLPDLHPGRYESEDRLEKRRKRTESDLRAVRSIVAPVLGALPGGGRGSELPETSPSELAGGVLAVLGRVARGTDTDDTALERLRRTLERIRSTLTRRTDFATAAVVVRGYLEIRIPAPRAEGTAPWSSAPGHLYLTDLASGGASGRAHTYIVGMDAGRFPGSMSEDPLLLDSERWRLARGALPSSRDQIQERRFQFAQLLARLRGSVTMSFPVWEPSEARALTPAPEILQAFRLREGDPGLTFADLEEALGNPESRLPMTLPPIDRDDAWLAALSTPDGRLLRGKASVGRAFPRLGAGQRAMDAWGQGRADVHTGILEPGPGHPSYLDAFSATYSATGLGTLGACPRRFLFRALLKAYPPDDPEFDPERWLDARQRGGLLHSVFEATLRRAREEGMDYDDPRFLEAALAFLSEEGERALREVPTPSRAVRDWEMNDLGDDVRSFVDMVRQEVPDWLALELRFGFEEDAWLPLGDGRRLSVRGAVDRVDDLGTHLRVVDYKTGRDTRFGKKTGIFDGGRRLQHLIYSAVAEVLYGKPVGSAEYHFPTRRGENTVHSYSAGEYASGSGLVRRMLEGVQAGWFPPTDTKDDCKFCDYREVCGVVVGKWDTESRPAEWSDAHLADLPELQALRDARRWENEQPVFGDGS